MQENTGKKVKLIRMEDPYTKLKPGDQGTIKSVDGIGNILVDWESGSTLSLIPDVDEYEIIDDAENSEDTIEESMIEQSMISEIFDTPELKQTHDIEYLTKGPEMIKSFKDMRTEGAERALNSLILHYPEVGYLYLREKEFPQIGKSYILFDGNDKWFIQITIYELEGKFRYIGMIKPANSTDRKQVTIKEAYGDVNSPQVRQFLKKMIDKLYELDVLDKKYDSKFLKN